MTQTMQIRPDFDRIRSLRGETRSPERLAAHYEVEARLASQLAKSGRQERSRLYAELYRQLFDAVPDHPQHQPSRTIRLDRIGAQAAWLRRWLTADATYVEIGCGDAALTKLVAAGVQRAIGVDVTPVLVTGEPPPGFGFLLSDGITLELPDASADLVYSNQLMEHLHVEDAEAQLRDIHRVLKPGGSYICCTPNRLSGPHDISVYFGEQPTGFHMREYDHRSLGAVFRSVGFSQVRALVTAKGRLVQLPVAVAGAVETCLEALPSSARTWLAFKPHVSNLLGLTLIGRK